MVVFANTIYFDDGDYMQEIPDFTMQEMPVTCIYKAIKECLIVSLGIRKCLFPLQSEKDSVGR